MKKIIFLAAIFLFSMFSYVTAGDFKDIAADEVKALLENKTKMVLVDARPAPEYSQGHIPRAINVPPEKVEVIGSLLPRDKKNLIVFYCRGAG